MTLPIVAIQDIPDDGLALSKALSPAWLAAQLSETEFGAGSKEGSCDLRLQRLGRDVLLTGSVDMELKVSCVRCLQDLLLPLHAELSLRLEPRGPASVKNRNLEVELRSEELNVDAYEGDKIDVGMWVREALLLEVPSYPRCEGECSLPGKTTSGAFDEIDPRLAALKRLVD